MSSTHTGGGGITEWRIPLGAQVKDDVPGYTGIVTGRHEYVYGCHRYSVQAQECKDGKPVDPIWVDDGHLKILKAKTAITPKNQETGAEGAPAKRSAPSRGSAPRR